MPRLHPPFRVYVGLIATGYLNTEAIEQVVQEGMAFCGATAALKKLPANGRILVQPDLTLADPTVARHSYTHPEVLRAVLHNTLRISRGRATVLGRTLPGFPASSMFKRATGQAEIFRSRGYYELENLFPGRVDLAPEERCELYRYQLSKGNVLSPNESRRLVHAPTDGRATNEIIAPREYHQSDFSIYCPKLKSSALAHGLSGAIRLGAAFVRGRLADHSICDMLEVCNPKLVISDGIIAGVGGSEVTQRGHELGVILISNNALSHDWIAAQILNLDPLRIEHLRIASERGWGPAASSQIELGGAGPEGVEQLAQKTQFWDLGLLKPAELVHKYGSETGLECPIEVLEGTAYEPAGADGALLEWLYLSYDFPKRRALMARWPKTSVLVGEVTRMPRHKLVFALGDAACRSLDRIVSSSRKLLCLKPGAHPIRFESAQLKNGRRHWIVRIEGSPHRLRDICFGFALGSLGRMVSKILTPGLLRDWVLSAFARQVHPITDPHQLRMVMTSRMHQNSWWALRPIPPAMRFEQTGQVRPQTPGAFDLR